MLLAIDFYDNTKVYEEVRTVNINKDDLEYYRTNHYPGERYTIRISDISNAFIIKGNEKIKLI